MLLSYSVFNGKSDVFNGDIFGQFDSASLQKVIDNSHLERADIFILVAKDKESVMETLHSYINGSVKRVLSSCSHY